VQAVGTKEEQIPASELWTKLASQKRPTKEVDFPRADPETGEPMGKLLMRPLKQGEILAAQSAALKYAKTLVASDPELAARIEGSPVYQNACACEILFRACMRIENPSLPLFPTAASVRDVRNGLTTDEVGVLMNAYEFVQLELGPIAAFLSEPAREALIERLREGGSAIPLASLSLAQWTDLTMHLVSRCPSSAMGSILPGTQPEELTLSTSE